MVAKGGKRPGAGRPKGAVSQAKRELMDMAKDHAEDALAVLVAIAKNGGASDAARVSAATAILDRGYGKPSQAVAVSNPDGSNIMPTMIQIIGVPARHDDRGGSTS